MSDQRVKGPFRADHVGSFLRPKELLDARDANQDGKMSADDLHGVEDKFIREIVKMLLMATSVANHGPAIFLAPFRA